MNVQLSTISFVVLVLSRRLWSVELSFPVGELHQISDIHEPSLTVCTKQRLSFQLWLTQWVPSSPRVQHQVEIDPNLVEDHHIFVDQLSHLENNLCGPVFPEGKKNKTIITNSNISHF